MDDQSETIIPRLSVMGYKKAKIFKVPDERGNLFVFQKQKNNKNNPKLSAKLSPCVLNF